MKYENIEHLLRRISQNTLTLKTGIFYLKTAQMDFLILNLNLADIRFDLPLVCKRINLIKSYSANVISGSIAKLLSDKYTGGNIKYYENLDVIPFDVLRFIYALRNNHQFLGRLKFII